MRKRSLLLYVLATGGLYGTERMALATARALGDEFDSVILAPAGPVAGEARKMGLDVRQGETTRVGALSSQIKPFLSEYARVAFFATRPVHTFVFAGMNLLYRRPAAHIFVAHTNGGRYHRRLNGLPVTIVAISDFVREQLMSHGVRERQIRVIENFLPAERATKAPRREPFRKPGVRRVDVISRLEPGKRVDLLLTCLENRPNLNSIEFHIYGTGSESDALSLRAKRSRLNVVFEGYRSDVDQQLAKSDLLLHLCPEEPFGLVMLEAMAARVPVLAPDRGGAGLLIEHGVTGLHFVANEAESLADALTKLCDAEPEHLNALVSAASAVLATRFSERERLRDYRHLIHDSIGDGQSTGTQMTARELRCL